MEDQKQRVYDALNKMGIKYEVVEQKRAIPLPMMRRKRTLRLSTAAVLSATPRKRASTRFCSLQN